MTKNLKKVTRWMKEGRLLSDETHPINFPKIMSKLEDTNEKLEETELSRTLEVTGTEDKEHL